MERGDIKSLIQRPAFWSRAPVRGLSASFLPLIAALMVVDLYLIFMWAPTANELHRYNLQRILYFHVPIAWVAFLAFFIVFVSSILYLWKRSARWDALAHSAAEIGVVFATLVLITGSIWAKGFGDWWWTWEPKLTTSLILWLIYVAYLMLRSYAPNKLQGATFAAVLGIVGFIDVPIVYFAADWWAGLHPQVVTGPLAGESASLDSSMRAVLMFSLFTFTLLFAFLLRERLTLRTLEDVTRRLWDSIGSPRK